MNEATIRLREIARASRYLARKQHPADMFTIEYRQDHCTDPEYRRMIAAMEAACDAGETTVRRSKRTGRVMFFEVALPRYTPDREYISREHDYLSTDIKIARLQMDAAGIAY